MKRKLVTVQKIANLLPISNADQIEAAKILGWTVVVKKNQFQIGDKCLFFEIDSVLPDGPEWSEFMRHHHFRVKTVKLRKCLSQGLILPFSLLENHDMFPEISVGTDVTEFLNVTKYEQKLPGGNVIGAFPFEIPKTDEIRLQSCIDILDELRDKPFYTTVKLDGTSSTFFKKNDELIICSRNFQVKYGGCKYSAVADLYDLEKKLPNGFAVQGEICGPGIQKNRLNLKSTDLFIFNVINFNEKRYLNYSEFVLFCHTHGLKTVPIDFSVETEDEINEFDYSLETFLSLADGKYDGTNNNREGLVVRPFREMKSDALDGSRLSFKVISNNFLLKDED